MTKKDYIKAAKIVQRRCAEKRAIQPFIDSFIELFADDNPRFDREKFEKACRQKSY